MATRTQGVSRFFIHYQKYIVVPIGIAIAIQIFLAVRVVFLPGNWGISGDGSSRGPYNNRNQEGFQKQFAKDNVAKATVDTNDNVIRNLEENVPLTQQITPVKNAPVSNSSLNLDLESLAFVPACSINIKDSISAIHRAKTQSCKEKIANLSCEILSDNLYVKRLPRLCKNNENIYGRYLGCFKDNPKDRILSGHLSIYKNKNCPQVCIDLCLQSGFQYAGVQYGVECFCGNVKPSANLMVENSKCDMMCPNERESTKIAPGSEHEKEWNGNCGGYFAMDVFETGVFQEMNNKIVGLDGRLEDGRLAGKPEKTAQIVFFLTLNGRSVRQVFRLIKALFQENHFFYIHVDSRQDYLFREILILSKILPNNVRFMQNRKATIWGGASLLTVLLSGMEDLVNNAKTWNWDWDYVINLSESDFPLKTTEKLETFLSHNRGRNFVKSHGRDVQKFIQKQGLDKTFFECEHRMWRVADRKLPKGIMIDGGSDWIALHRDFVEYIITTKDDLVSGLKTVFTYTLLPAESFFHTVLRNSNHCSSFVDNNLHVTNWKRKLGCKCQYRNVVDWCGCSPNDFRIADWNRLLLAESRILFFGRKFEPIVSQSVINKMELWLYPDRFETHYPTMDRFWLSLYHLNDLSPKPDDALVTLGRSLARIASKNFASKYNFTILFNTAKKDFNENTTHSNENELDTLVKLIEITAYSHDDTFQGILIKFSFPVTKHTSLERIPEVYTLSMESWFGLKSHVKFAPWSKNIAKYRSKIQDIAIGVDYDQKEQIFRNFARSIGPFSEPALRYTIVSDEPFNITAVFTDPTGIVQAVHNGSGGDGSGNMANFIKPALKTPLQPGTWVVKILTVDGYLLAEEKMLVLPLEIYQGKVISVKNLLKINTKIVSSDESERDSSVSVDYIETLSTRIDELVSEFYTIQDHCLEDEQNHALLSKLRAEDAKTDGSHKAKLDKSSTNELKVEIIETSLCSHTQWSSLFPDPKSVISGINQETGRLFP